MTATGSDFVRSHYALRSSVSGAFFRSEADRVAALCYSAAGRFARGGRLIAFGAGAAATDAQHVAVEFVHPVIVGKRALPALALVNDVSGLGSALRDPTGFFARRLGLVGRSEDLAVGLVHGRDDPGAESVAAAMKEAAANGILSVWLGAPGCDPGGAEYAFEVDSDDPFVVQEVQETLYHVVWELVHVFFEHRGLLDGDAGHMRHDAGDSSFLYPFLSASETHLDEVMTDLAASVLAKSQEVTQMRQASMDPEGLTETAALVARRLAAGGKVLCFGNGGSATDAEDLVADLVDPPRGMKPVPAISLTNDSAVITAVGNDVGFDNVFARQVIAHGEQNDVAIAISTSGGSRDVLVAVEEAKRRGLLTVAFAGYSGGRLSELCDRSHTIEADHIPRIQEAQATQYHILRRLLEVA